MKSSAVTFEMESHEIGILVFIKTSEQTLLRNLGRCSASSCCDFVLARFLNIDLLQSCSASPTEVLLRYLVLPDAAAMEVDLRQCAVVVMSHLDRLASPYMPPSPNQKVLTGSFTKNKRFVFVDVSPVGCAKHCDEQATYADLTGRFHWRYYFFSRVKPLCRVRMYWGGGTWRGRATRAVGPEWDRAAWRACASWVACSRSRAARRACSSSPKPAKCTRSPTAPSSRSGAFVWCGCLQYAEWFSTFPVGSFRP